MAELFLAQDTEREELVVIKRILPYLSHEAEFVQMFLDEARIAAQLHHPNIIQVFELGKLQDSIFLAMEFVEGVDARKVLQQESKRGQPMPYGAVAYITAQICAGLEYAHTAIGVDGRRLEVVHRDVSPQNVMVSFDGDIKLVDFGIAKAGALVERSKPGVIKGKFLYLSPEQLSQERLDNRADLFAVGTMMYELTTGKAPFYKPTTEAVIYAIRHEEPVPPQQARPDFPPELARIIMKCLVKDRNRRYQHAAEVQRDLEAFLRSHPFGGNELSTYIAQLFGTEDERTVVHIPTSEPPRELQRVPVGKRHTPPEAHVPVLPPEFRTRPDRPERPEGVAVQPPPVRQSTSPGEPVFDVTPARPPPLPFEPEEVAAAPVGARPDWREEEEEDYPTRTLSRHPGRMAPPSRVRALEEREDDEDEPPRSPFLFGALAFLVVLGLGLLGLWLYRTGYLAMLPEPFRLKPPDPVQTVGAAQPESGETPAIPLAEVPDASVAEPGEGARDASVAQASITGTPDASVQVAAANAEPEARPVEPPPPPRPVPVVFRGPRGMVVRHAGKRLNLNERYSFPPGSFSYVYACPGRRTQTGNARLEAKEGQGPVILTPCKTRR